MLPVYLDISKSLVEKANHNIYLIFEWFIEDCKNQDEEAFLQKVFPPFYLRKNPQRCMEIIYEMKDMILDSYERDYLKPIYEYVLYMMIEWWQEISEKDMGAKISKSEISNEDEKYIAKNINNIEEYKSFMFEDWDFLDVPTLFKCYIQNPNLVSGMFNIELNDYIELMPDDIKEKFETMRSKLLSVEIPILPDDEEFVIKSIYNALIRLESYPRDIEEFSETVLSNLILNILHNNFYKKGISIEREAPGGYSKKQTGELDFSIYKYDDSGVFRKLAVGENKEWGKFENSIKQLIGYMDNNIPFGFTIIFNKKTKLNSVLDRRIEILNGFNVNGNFRSIEKVETAFGLNNVLVTKHENPEQPGSYFNLYHFIINTYNPDRVEAARQARV